MPLVSREEARAKGLTTFFTGIPCLRGHVDVRNTSSGQCRTCNLDAQFERSRRRHKEIITRWAKYRAKAKGIPFAITSEDFVIPSHCPCCGVRLVPKEERLTRMKTGAHDSPSLDRKVPSLGYVPGNIAILCMACNAKKAGIDEQMLKFLLDYLG